MIDKYEKYLFYKRSFLNLEKFHSIGTIFGYIKLSKWKRSKDDKEPIKDEEYNSIDVQLTISDCSKSINLSVELDNNDDYANTIYKLETLISSLTEFKVKLELAKSINNKIDKRRLEENNKLKDEPGIIGQTETTN